MERPFGIARVLVLVGLALLVMAAPAGALAQEVIPPAPKTYVHDQANVINKTTAQQLEQKLQQFERETSIQFVVAVFPKMQSDSDVADYAQRVAERWGVGQKKTDNGVVLFVFVEDRQVYITTGYGVEGALPDATAKQIIEDEIVPRFRQGDYSGGVVAGATAVIAATRGEYKGTGRTVGEGKGNPKNHIGGLIVFLLIMFFMIFGRSRGYGYGHHGYGRAGRFGHHRGGGFGGFGGFGGGGGGFGGGGFSGGGGGFGGGGAGGRW